MQKRSVILLGHGSKSADAIDDFNYMVETIRDKSGIENVYGAHMEFAEPSLEKLVSELHTKGQKQLLIVPYFLFNGNHIKKDIPAIIAGLETKYPDLDIAFGSPIGKDPMMADLILKKIRETAS